jgi:hypothetical protein
MALKKQLDTPYPINVTITKESVDSFSFDLTNQLIHIGYSIIKSDGQVYQSDRPLTLSGTDYTDFIARMNLLNQSKSAQDAQFQTILEYTPGQGVISGDEKVLNNPYTINGNVLGQEIDSYALNPDDNLIHIGYSLLETITTALLTDQVWTLSGVEVDEFLIRFNELGLTMDATAAEITTLLEFLPGAGTIVDI